MITEEKIKFIMEVLEKASQQSFDKYEYIEKFWIDKYLTASNLENSLRIHENNLESAYQAALTIQKK